MAISLPVVECVNHCRSFWVRNGALRGDEEPNICLYLYVIHNEKSRCNPAVSAALLFFLGLPRP